MKLLCSALALCFAAVDVHAQAACTADFSAFGQGRIAVEIQARPDGRFDALVNGSPTHAGGTVLDEGVRPGLDLATDPYGPAFAQPTDPRP